jgi:protein SCO1/2
MNKRFFLGLLVLIAARPLSAAGAAVATPEYAAGKPLAIVNVIDETGRARSAADWKGLPTILVPIYTRCPLACPTITAGMKRAAADAKASPTSYRVVLFSFDGRDRPEDLRRFRERHHVPLAWTIVTAKEADIRTMLDSVGYHFASANGLFDHPNLVIALTADLKTAKYMPGTSYDLDAALAAARDGRDWVGQFGGYMLALLLLVCILSAVCLFVLVGRMRTADAH